MHPDARSASLKQNLRDVDIDGPSNHSSTSGHSKDDVQMVLSSSSNQRPQVVWEEDELPFDLEVHAPAAQEPSAPLPLLVFAWHCIARATCGVFAILNDYEQPQDTRFMVFFLATMFALLNMLLLSMLKPRKLNNVLCAYAVFSSVESCVLVLLPDFLFYTLPSLLGAWLLLFLLSLNPCAKIRSCCAQRTTARDNHFAYRRPQPHPCCSLRPGSLLYLRVLWFLLLSIVCEAGNVVYFWFLMQTFDQEYDTRRQRIVLCCINLKLLFTTYTRHMLFERRFSYLAMCSEFSLFAITCAVIYLNAFLQITDEQYLILRYTFWTALGLEILVNFIMFVRFSAHAL